MIVRHIQCFKSIIFNDIYERVMHKHLLIYQWTHWRVLGEISDYNKESLKVIGWIISRAKITGLEGILYESSIVKATTT